MEDDDIGVGHGPALDEALSAQIGGQDGTTHDLEHEGQIYQIPAQLKGAFMAHKHYQAKSQALADHKIALEAAHVHRQDLATLAQVDAELGQLQSVDWEAFMADDPEAAQAAMQHAQDLAARRQGFAAHLNDKMTQAEYDAHRVMGERLAAAGEVLSREIAGWSPQLAARLVEYAGEFGVTPDELREVADPRLWTILHRAHAGDYAARTAAAGQVVQKAQMVRPAVQIAGAAAPVDGLRDDMPIAEWMRRRNAQALANR